jgi:enoyl-CoA hydratase/carnithine racemase
LTDWFAAAQHRTDIHAVVIAGKGADSVPEATFTTSIGALQGRPMAEVLAFTRMTGELIGNMRRFDRPIVSAIHGVAAARGPSSRWPPISESFRTRRRSPSFSRKSV